MECNNPLKIKKVKDFFSNNKLDILAVLETRIRSQNIDKSIHQAFVNYRHLFAAASSNVRILLLWNDTTIQVTPILFTSQLIHCLIKHNSFGRLIHCSFVYGSNEASGRLQLWAELVNLSSNVKSWLVMGDFNTISSGCEFTWTNNQDPPHRIWSRLDRALVNYSWLTEFPSSVARVLPSGVSDHSPLIVEILDDVNHHARFSFLNCWSGHSDYKRLVDDVWSTQVYGTAIFRLFEKLKLLRKPLQTFHRQHFSKIDVRANQAKEELNSWQLLHHASNDADILATGKVLMAEYIKLKKVELEVVHQKVKVDKVLLNDKSTSYFFAKIRERRQAQMIGAIKDMEGKDQVAMAKVNAAFVQYYEDLLGRAIPVEHLDSPLDGAVLDSSHWIPFHLFSLLWEWKCFLGFLEALIHIEIFLTILNV